MPAAVANSFRSSSDKPLANNQLTILATSTIFLFRASSNASSEIVAVSLASTIIAATNLVVSSRFLLLRALRLEKF